ncbi:MAG: argininosuccinate synthase [Hydrogenophilales bacterium]
MKKENKIILAYSGGLDTSVILKWLQINYDAEVITYTADIGQGEELSPARKKAKLLGVKNIIIEDLKEEFAKNYVYPMLRANAVYEGRYLLGTSIARPLIAKRLVEIAKKFNSYTISHGATGKGNDQVRFELSAYALNPKIKIIAPWRTWDLMTRSKLLTFAKENKIPIDFKKKGSNPYSMDANLLHISYEGEILEDLKNSPNENMWRITKSLPNAKKKPNLIKLKFKNGNLVAINDIGHSPAKLIDKLNKIAGSHGIGRLDMVESRYVGIKSRGCYETPAGTVILFAKKIIESVTLDREVIALREDLMPRYARLVYNGYWFSPERILLQTLFDQSQEHVNGTIDLELFMGNITIKSIDCKKPLYNQSIASFDLDNDLYDQSDAEGFIKINSVRLKNQTKRI